jgi:hypothetical protein
MQRYRHGVFKPLRKAAQGSTERTRSLRNSTARLVVVAFGVVNITLLRDQSKEICTGLNDRVEVVLSSENHKGQGIPLSSRLSSFLNKYRIDPERLFYNVFNRLRDKRGQSMTCDLEYLRSG